MAHASNGLPHIYHPRSPFPINSTSKASQHSSAILLAILYWISNLFCSVEDEELRMEDLLHLDNHFRILAKTPSRLIPKCSATSRKTAFNVPGLSGL